MENKLINQFNFNKEPRNLKECNEPKEDALLAMGEKIKKAKFDAEAPLESFREDLRAKILERRKRKNFMREILSSLAENLKLFLKPRRAIPAIATIVLLAIIISAVYYWPGGGMAPGQKTNLFKEFSRLVISPAHAQDNFKLYPTNSDSLGTDGNSTFVLESKSAIDAGLIKENLKIEPSFDYDLKSISDKEWQIIPKEKLDKNTLVKVAIAAAYFDESGKKQERDFSWVYQIKDTFKVINTIPRDTGVDVPANTGIEVTFSHDNFEKIEQYFEILPKVEGRFEKHGRTAVFVPNNPLNKGTIYQVIVKKGLPLLGSTETLVENFKFSFETQRVRADSPYGESWFNIYRKTIETGSEKTPVIQVSGYGFEKDDVKVSVFKFSGWQDYLKSRQERENLPWWSLSQNDFLVDVSKLQNVVNFSQKIKSEKYGQYIVFPENLPTGFYLAELSIGNFKNQVWLQVTDTVAYLNVTKTDTIVWVNDLISKSPVENAKIELLDTDQIYQTNNKGVALFKTPNAFVSASDTENAKYYYFKISNGNKLLIMQAANPVFPSSHYSGYYSGSSDIASNFWQYLYTDRPRYQTNDTIKFWGLVKSRTNEKNNEKITISLNKEGYVDYYYQPIKITEQEVKLTDLDTFSGEFKLNNLRPDYYTLELSIGKKVIQRKYININPYTKPAYQLSLTPDQKHKFAGENINLKVQASFFEGTPVPDLKLVFKMPEENYYHFTTDKNGQADLTYAKKYFDCADQYGCWPHYANLSIYPEEGESTEIGAEAYVNFYGPKVYLKKETQYPEKGIAKIKMTTKKIDLLSMDQGYWWEDNLGKEIAPRTKIEGDIIKITYIKQETGAYYDFINKKTYKTYNYNQKKEKVNSFKAETNDAGEYVLEQKVEPETSYLVKMKVFDNDGRYEIYNEYLYYYNGETVNWYTDAYYQYYHFDIDRTKEKFYSVGEQVQTQILVNDEPLPEGQNKFLFIQAKNGLQEYAVNSSPKYQFTFEERDIPNVNLIGIYFNGNSYIIVGNEYYEQPFIFNKKERVLKIDIRPDKDQYRPGEDVNLMINVKDINDQPVAAEVNLNLVDEAYYAVAEDYANPINVIYANVGAGSLYVDKSHFIPEGVFGADGKGGCFAAGTKILMADGSSKPIEKIEVGDLVMTFDDPLNKEKTSGRVTEFFKHTVGEYLIINDDLKVTPEHLVFANYHFTAAGNLKVGDWMLKSSGDRVFIKSVKLERKIVPVYNFRVDPQHTYFANNYYVHNDKDGGGVRENFVDAALFTNVKTNSAGFARVNFKLPDNITSWRLTAQAISSNLFVGVNTSKIPVSLPVFAEVTIGAEYLRDDKPIVRLRAFGTALAKNDPVDFYVSAPGLGTEKSQVLSSEAFKPTYFELPELKLGKQDIVYSMNSAKGNDSIKLPLYVLESRLRAEFAKSEVLTKETKIATENNLPVTVVLSDRGQNELYPYLLELSWSWGDRIDQKLSRKRARELLKKYYGEEILKPNFNSDEYQVPSGGISLLPYSSEDLELSVRTANLGAEEFDREALSQYLFRKLEDKKSNREEISLALSGLAALEKPVLPRISDWLKRDDLSAKEKLYLAQALYNLGAGEWSRNIFYQVLEKYGATKKPHIIIKISENQDEVFEATALAAALAAALNVPERDGLWLYVNDSQKLYGINKNSEILLNFEKLSYLENALPNLKPSPANVIYELDGRRSEINITGGQIHTFNLEPQQIDKLKFLEIRGDVGISTRLVKPMNLSEIKPDPNIQIRREYYVNGRRATSFKESDTIQVRLYYSLDEQALNSDYQITDILPSGLVPITQPYFGSDRDSSCQYFWYFYNNEGQFVKFKIDRNWLKSYCNGKYIRYYARPKNRGEFKAEPVIIQSFLNPDFINFSTTETIKITE